MTNEPADHDFEVDGDYSNIEVVLPKFRNLSLQKLYDYDANVVDYEDLQALNSSIREARLSLFLATQKINEYERSEREAKLNYERSRRRSLLSQTDKTASQREAKADLACEELENEFLFYSQMKSELERSAYALRQELQALQNLGNNIRQQVKVL